MKIRKGGSTRDLICLDFDYGSRSYEEEMKHLQSTLTQAGTEAAKQKILEIMDKVTANKQKYIKHSKEEIRELYYTHGTSVLYQTRDGQGRLLKEECVHYKMLYRNSSKAKQGQVLFIREGLYEAAYDWLTMGLGNRLPAARAKIVELSAYAPLTASTIQDTMQIRPEEILLVKDLESHFSVLSNMVRSEAFGSLKRCVVHKELTDITCAVWNGMGLIEASVLPDWVNGMALLRNHFFKMCGFKGHLQRFFQDWCMKNGKDYETYKVTDLFGRSHKLREIKVITTNNAVKWGKFVDLMGGTPESAYQYWCDRIRADGENWGIVKTDHPSKLGSLQQMSYQMVNTLPCIASDVAAIASTSVKYVESLKRDPDLFEEFLRKNANEVNHYEMMADLYAHNHQFADSTWFRTEKKKIISRYVMKLRSGKITVPADNLTVCGNPYALLLYAVGEDYKEDPTLAKEQGAIQCYTPRFQDGEYLCAYRNPQNAPNNICYLHNRYSPGMSRYFPFSGNILAVNCIGTDIQARANGMDFDSDFMFVSNHPTLVKCAKVCYESFPTIVNGLKESGITYQNTPSEYARMDHRMAQARRGIGEASNLAQLSMTYYWTAPSQELYDHFMILSVLAQVIIDGSKREYEVDAISEIKRLRRMDCMNGPDGQPLGLPLFMKYTKEVPTIKNGVGLPYEEIQKSRQSLDHRINPNLCCPMNWLQECLDQIQGAGRGRAIPTGEFFVKMPGTATASHMTKIRKLVEDYDSFIKLHHEELGDESFQTEFETATGAFYEKLGKIKIRNPVTVNRLVETALALERPNNNPRASTHNSSKYSRRLLNTLYRMDRQRFLKNFTEG